MAEARTDWTCPSCGKAQVLKFGRCGFCGMPAMGKAPVASRADRSLKPPRQVPAPLRWYRARPRWQRILIVVVGIWVGIGAVDLAVHGPRGDTTSRWQPSESNLKEDAWSMCKKEVTSLLKAPSTASFPWYDEPNVAKRDKAPGYVVKGYVDAQNSFGATLRNHWICTAEPLGDKRWKVDAALIQ